MELMEPRYFVWLLLPLCFLTLGTWAYIKKLTNRPGQEDIKEYFVQGFFCLMTVAVSVLLDITLVENYLASARLGAEELPYMRWLLYPATLVAMAYINTFIGPKQENDERDIGSRVIH